MAYRADVEVDPASTDYQALLNKAGQNGIKVLQTGQTGTSGFPLYQMIAGNRGQLQSMLGQLGFDPSTYSITQFDPNA